MSTRRKTEEISHEEWIERLCGHVTTISDASVDFFRTVHELQDFLHYTKSDRSNTSNALTSMLSDAYQASAAAMTQYNEIDRMLVLLNLVEPREKN